MSADTEAATPRDRLAALLGFPDAAWLVQHISDGRAAALADEIEQGRAALAKIAVLSERHHRSPANARLCSCSLFYPCRVSEVLDGPSGGGTDG